MIRIHQNRKIWKYVGCVMLTLALMGNFAIDVFAELGSDKVSASTGTIVGVGNITIPDNNRIAKGDVVTVYGKIDNSFFKSRAITAETVEKIGVYSRESSSRR